MPRAPEGTPHDAFEDGGWEVCEAVCPIEEMVHGGHMIWMCSRPVHIDGPHVASMGPDPDTDWCATWEDQ